MSKSNSVPYHLRTNKSIDRQIFFEILTQLILPKKIQQYRYVSMGGAMLEDHHTLHNSLGLLKLLSLERNDAVLSRQDFNKNYNCIDCAKSTTKDFIQNFHSTESNIIWLDYTDTSWASQFLECYELLSKLVENDIFKVTFNANPDALYDSNDSSLDKLNIFKKRASSRFVNENITINDVSVMDRFATTICEIFQAITASAAEPDDYCFYPITIFRYIDNRHQMLSITGIMLNKNSANTITELLNKSHLDIQPHICKSWSDIHSINVPDLTHRERFELNRLLPLNSEIDSSKLPFKIDANKTKSDQALANYAKYYRYIPNFQKLAT